MSYGNRDVPNYLARHPVDHIRWDILPAAYAPRADLLDPPSVNGLSAVPLSSGGGVRPDHTSGRAGT